MNPIVQRLTFITIGFAWIGVASAAPITVGATALFDENGTGTANANATGDNSGGDTFTITNTSGAGVGISSLVIDLNAGSVFEIAGGAPGQSPASAFAIVTNTTGATATPVFSSGDNVLTITFTLGLFDPGESFVFTVDVDSTAGGNDDQRFVSGAEFAGSTLSVTFANGFVGAPEILSANFGTVVDPTQALATINQQRDDGVLPPPDPEPTPVPEPASLALWTCLALVGLVVLRRRRDQYAVEAV